MAGMQLDDIFFTKESLLKLTALSNDESIAMQESLRDMRKLSQLSPSVISRNMDSMELWNRYLPILTYPACVLIQDSKMRGQNLVGIQFAIPPTFQVPAINNDPSVAGSQATKRKRRASDPLNIPTKRDSQNKNKEKFRIRFNVVTQEKYVTHGKDDDSDPDYIGIKNRGQMDSESNSGESASIALYQDQRRKGSNCKIGVSVPQES
jgi:hypothetical protein